MAARFPQSGSSIAYQIKAAYASKIKALYWAAGANSVHRLRPGDTSTTVLTRATSGATFNSAEGRISGTYDGTTYFTDYAASGSYFASANADVVFLLGAYGDVFNGVPSTGGRSRHILIGGGDHGDTSFSTYPFLYGEGFNCSLKSPGGGAEIALSALGDNTPSLETFAYRYYGSDATARSRLWRNGSELTGSRNNSAASSGGGAWGSSTKTVTFGASFNSGTNSTIEWEFGAVGDGATLTDSDLAAITADPTVLIEAVAADSTPPTLSSPGATVTGTSTATLSVSTNEGNGNAYAVVTTSSTAPSAAQIRNGQNHLGTAATFSTSKTVTAIGAQTFASNPSSLSGGTTYYAHYHHRDAAGNDSAVVTSAAFTTTTKKWRIPTNAPNGTVARVMVFGGTAGAYTLDTQAISTVSSGQIEIAGTGAVGEKKFAAVHNYSDNTATTSIYGGFCIATLVEV